MKKEKPKKKNEGKMLARLMNSIMPVLILVLIAVILFAFTTSKSMIRNSTRKLMQKTTNCGVLEIESWNRQTLSVLQTAGNTIQNMQMSKEEVLSYVESYLGTYETFPNGIYLVQPDGNVIDASGWVPDTDPREKSYYQQGLTHDTEFVYGEPYLDDLTKTFVVTATRNLNLGGNTTAVAAADVDLSILSQVVSSIEIEGNGDAFILDMTQGQILAHKNAELNGIMILESSNKLYQKLFENLQNGMDETQTISIDGEGYLVDAERIDGTNWYMVSCALESAIFSSVYRLRNIMIVIGIVALIIVAVTMNIIMIKTVRPITEMTKIIYKVKEGDFTTECNVNAKDEVGRMSESIECFLESMRITIRELSEIGQKLDKQAIDNADFSINMNESAKGQYEEVMNLKTIIVQLTDSIEYLAQSATTLAQVVAKTDQDGNIVVEKFKGTMQHAEDGKKYMERVSDAMQEIKDTMDLLSKKIGVVGKLAEKINEIIIAISNIAEETDMLSLNASIEAARAGEEGKSFEVVALQIKKLAETSAQAAEQISVMLKKINDEIVQTVEQSHMSAEQIEVGTNMVEMATDRFDGIYQGVGETNDIVNEIIQKIHEVNDVATNMAAITQQQSASTEEIEKATENILELSKMVTEESSTMQEDSKNMSNLAEELTKHISQFKI